MRKLNVINIFLSVLTALTVQTAFAQDPHRFVNNFDDFIAHTKSHISEVQALGQFAHSRWFGDFGQVPIELLNDYLNIHDLAKTADLETLRKFGYTSDQTLGERLYEFYGKNPNSLSENEQIRFRAIVNEVNAIDHLIRMEFLLSRGLIEKDGLESPLVKLLQKIELLADLTSRGASLVSPEEFAREMKSSADFFKDPSDKAKVILMEAYMYTIVDNKFVRESGARSCKNTHL